MEKNSIFYDELYHHGIKGQKWGVRNGPPYPLKEGSKSKAEKKQGDLNKQGFIDPVTATYATLAVAYLSVIAIKKGAEKVSEMKTNKKLSEITKSKETKIDEKTGFHLRDSNEPPEEDIKNVNPLWDEGKTKSVSNNCVLCSLAIEMRRRGYDVIASTESKGLNGLKVTSEAFPGGEPKSVDTYGLFDPESVKNCDLQFAKNKSLSDYYAASNNALMGKNTDHAKNVVSTLSKEPNNSRGSIFVQWPFGGGHAMAYEVKNGTPVIYDGQSGKVYKGSELETLLSKTVAANYYRTDDREFDVEKLRGRVM